VDQDLYRAALAVACVFAVVLGASLFPATGFGTNPVPASSSGNGSAGTGGGPGTATTTATGTETSTTSDESTATTTEPTSTAEVDDDGPRTTTEAPAYDDASSGGEQGALLALATVLFGGTLLFLVCAVGLGRHHRRRYPSDWDLPSAPHLRLLAYVRRIPQTSLAFVMFAGTNAPGVLDGLADRFGAATSGLGAAASGIGSVGSAIGRGLLAVPGGFVTAVGRLGRGIGSFSLGLSALSTAAGSGGLFGRSEDAASEDPRSGASATATEAPEPDEPDPPASVREAWNRLQADLGVSGRDGATPGEIARAAIDRGLPTDAIRSLTRAFRDVRYGGLPDDGERVTVAREAYERVRAALEGESS